MAIQRLDQADSKIENQLKTKNDSIGIIYAVKVAKWGSPSDDGYKMWHIDDSLLIAVLKNGEYAFYSKEEGEQLSDLKIDRYLNWDGRIHYQDQPQNTIVNFSK